MFVRPTVLAQSFLWDQVEYEMLFNMLICGVNVFVAGNVWGSGRGSGGLGQGNSGAAWNSGGTAFRKPGGAERIIHTSTDHLAQLCSGVFMNLCSSVCWNWGITVNF